MFRQHRSVSCPCLTCLCSTTLGRGASRALTFCDAVNVNPYLDIWQSLCFNSTPRELPVLYCPCTFTDLQPQPLSIQWCPPYPVRDPCVISFTHHLHQGLDPNLAAASPLVCTCPPPRQMATLVVSYAAQSAFLLLDRVCRAAYVVLTCSSSSRAGKKAAQKALGTMVQRGFMLAVADAARGMADVEALVRPGTGPLQGVEGPAFLHATAAASTAPAVCKYMRTVAELVFDCLGVTGVGSGGQPASFLPSGVVEVVQTITEAQLLATAAAAVVDSPNLTEAEGLPPAAAQAVRSHMGSAAEDAAVGLAMYVARSHHLARSGERKGQRLAGGLLRAMRHVAVRRLQVALLDQLAAHAGMGPELGGEGEEREGEQQAAQAEGWAGSSGTWWFAVEEARSGQILSASNVGRRSGWLEDHHCHIVHAALGDWGAADVQTVAAAAGVPAGPPPLLAARLAARAAESLARLCRGEGLGGAYGKAPEWQLAMAPVGCASLEPGRAGCLC